jgi:hypothetical protein
LLAKASLFWLQSTLIALDLPAFERPAKATSRSGVAGRQWVSLTVVANRA